ncbi:MAG TPA: rhodanese-like domain-containing protein [Steroidobacteraceae bacterium]|nr:rhodanese-like domain-containing protein [Steroidobacteraceae bacterium]
MRHALALAALLALSAAPPALGGDAVPVEPGTLLGRLAWGDQSLLVLDVRTPEEYAAGHVPGARNIPHTQIAERLAELGDARDRDVVVYCRSGSRSAIALATLREAGFTRLLHLEGDWLRWSAEERPVIRGP